MLTINLRSITVALYICAGLLLGGGYCHEAFGQVQQQTQEKGVLDPITTKTDLYPADADAKHEIEVALKRATSEKKRVILVFGANWCYDCHVLDRALHQGAAGKLVKDSFLLVHVDIGEGDKNTALAKKYKIPIEKGVPAVALLASDGNLIYSSGAGEFESARSMMKKDLFAFLTQWKRQPK
jgi:thiol:disulfide interchange protein